MAWKTRWKVWKSTRYSGESKAFHKVSAIYGKAIYFTHSFLRHVVCGYAKKQHKMDWKRHFGIYNKRRVFSDKTKGPPKRAFKSTEYLKVMPQPFLFYCGGRESLRRRSQRKRGIRRLLRHRTLCRRWCQRTPPSRLPRMPEICATEMNRLCAVARSSTGASS